MFIIFGSPRSGTTLLKEMLCQHPDIEIPNETDFIIPLAFILDRVRDEVIGKRLVSEMICSTTDFAPSLGRYLSQDEVIKTVQLSNYTLSDLLEGLYSAVAKKSSSLLSGDKSPNDLGFVGILKKTGLFDSNLIIIHIIRDVRDVILSLKKTGWAPLDVENYFPRIWENSNLNLRRFATQGTTPYILVKYEDLVTNPPAELKKICGLLNVDFDPSMCEYKNLGQEFAHMSHHSNLGKEMLQDRVFAWKKHSDINFIEECQSQAYLGLRQFCYE